MDLASNPYVPYVVAAVGGLFVGWLLTWWVGRRRNEQYEAQIYDLQSRQKTAERALAEAREQGEELQTKLTASQNSLSEAGNKLSALESEHQTLQDEKAALATSLEERTNELSDLNDQYSQLQQAHEQAQQTAAEENTLLQASVDAAQVENQALEEQLADVSAQNQTLTEQLEATRGQLDQLVSNLEAVKATLNRKDVALNEAYGRVGLLQRDLDEREVGLLATQAELAATREELAAATVEKSELEDRLHRARGDVAGEMALVTSTMLKRKDDALRQANARISALSHELEALKSAQGSS